MCQHIALSDQFVGVSVSQCPGVCEEGSSGIHQHSPGRHDPCRSQRQMQVNCEYNKSVILHNE